MKDCPICGNKLSSTDNSCIPITSTCEQGCKKYSSFYCGMGDEFVSIGEHQFSFLSYPDIDIDMEQERKRYEQALENSIREWRDGNDQST